MADNTAGKITFVIPYAAIGPVIEETFREEAGGDWELDIIHTIGVRDLAALPGDSTDVFVARGVTAAGLRRAFPATPVVDMPVSGYDIMRAVRECRRRFGAARIGIVGSHHMTYGAKSLETILDNVAIDVVEVRDEDDALPSIAALRDQGVTVVIGGVMSTTIAGRLGLDTVYIQTGREAVYGALREALRVARVRRQEQERAERLRIILDYSAEGIVAVDAAGAVNLVNAAAAKLTGCPGQAAGLPAGSLFPELGLERVLAAGKAEVGEIATLGGQQVAVNRVPILVGGRTAGAVATFQPVAAIQELEGKIRRKIYQRGHIAKRTFADIIGDSHAITHTLATARRYARADATLLITGETGTGKEIFAQSVHNAGPRAQGPFVAVNCAALPESLLESELFGYSEGAFTGAAKGGKMGLFEQAHRGTIFLDEISEISPKLQGRLLRVLQEREIMRLGDDRVIPVDIRVIAATNRDLHALMRQGGFREDLYYRVDILRLAIPPLRDRREDIPPLLGHFLATYARQTGNPCRAVSPAARDALLAYPWPGNVRELRNIAERLAVLGGGDITAADIAAVLAPPPAKGQGGGAAPAAAPVGKTGANRDILLQVLAANGYHYGRAAAALGISRTTLWRRLKENGDAGDRPT